MVEAEIKGKPASLQPKNKWHGYNNITLKLNKFKSIKMTTAKTADPPAKPD
jgi:hypothetical protein